jgi:hypothetical protein
VLSVVARAGVEPATFHFSGERCYQLSYLASPDPSSDGSDTKAVTTPAITAFATPTGLEPATSAVTGRRANQLRYGAWWCTPHRSARETIAQPRRGSESVRSTCDQAPDLHLGGSAGAISGRRRTQQGADDKCLRATRRNPPGRNGGLSEG